MSHNQLKALVDMLIKKEFYREYFIKQLILGEVTGYVFKADQMDGNGADAA